jgi:hypothetical protein
MSSTAQYPSVTCVVCNQLMTHHRCMQPVKKGLLVIAVVGVVCGKPICGPCNYQHGNEGIFRCPVHSVSDVSSDDDSVAGNKEDAAVILSGKSQITKSGTSGTTTSNKSTKVMAKGNKGAEYTAKDLLILSQSFIRVSENAVEGTSKKQSKFWDEVAEVFNQLKKQQEAYDARVRKRQKLNKVRLKGDFLSSDEEDEDVCGVVVTPRTASSLQQKWSKFVLPLVTKFVIITVKNPKRSGVCHVLMFLFFHSIY